MSAEQPRTPSEVQLQEALRIFDRGVSSGLVNVEEPGQKAKATSLQARFNELRAEMLEISSRLAVYAGLPSALVKETPPVTERATKLASLEVISEEDRLIRIAENTYSFGPNEFSILKLLAENVGNPVHPAYISRETGIPRRIVRTTIYHIRQKIEEDPRKPKILKSVLKGQPRGYLLDLQTASPAEPEEKQDVGKPTPRVRRRGLYTTAHAAGVVGVSRNRVTRYCREGTLVEGEDFVSIGTGEKKITVRLTKRGIEMLKEILEEREKFPNMKTEELLRRIRERGRRSAS